jgi:glycosyltransferase involved in cell wall biosynthesis
MRHNSSTYTGRVHGGARPRTEASVPSEPGTAAGLRILAIGNMYPPQHAGGYELAWQAAMVAARAIGHRVRVLTSDYRDHRDRGEEEPDVHRTLRWYWDLERYEFPHLTLRQRLQLERHNAAQLHRHLVDFRPDVVAWWSMGCMSLSLIETVRRAGIPAVFVVHDDWLEYGWEHDQWMRTWRGRRRRLAAPIVERTCGVPARVDVNRAGAFVFNSRYTLERARRVRVSAPAATVVNPGIDDRFQEPLDPHPWRWRLVYVGRIDRQKGVDTAVAALAHLPRTASLSVWGSGDERYVAEMRTMAQRLGVTDRVRFEAFVDADKLRSVYADADVIVFPVRWNEPFGLVPLEAMGVGTAVATTARGGTAEFIRAGENALVFAADDAEGLAVCVTRLAGDPELRTRLRENGLRTAAQYTASRFAEQTVTEIERAVRHPGRGASRASAVT